MASGKTRLGKRLAAKLNYRFIDLDAFIEQQYGASISHIFSYQGEQVFRSIESKALQSLLNEKAVVISCGGGTPCFSTNAKEMNNSGRTVFLKVKEEIILDRLWRNRQSRPLVAKFNSVDELGQYVQQLLGERMKFYKTAQICYDNSYPRSDLSDLICSIRSGDEEE